MSSSPYPWQTHVWQLLTTQLTRGILPHALLFVGPQGIGKRSLATVFVKRLLCLQATQTQCACEQCRACQLVNADTHPDFVRIAPEEAGGVIKIEQIRAVTEFLEKTAQFTRGKVVMIEPAEAMNIAAINALLKTVEEPTPNTVIILISAYPNDLPATLRTRCHRVVFKIPRWQEARQWLETQLLQHDTNGEKSAFYLSLAEGAPLRAWQLRDESYLSQRAFLLKQIVLLSEGNRDPIQLAAEMVKCEFEDVLSWLISWSIDLMRLCFGLPSSVVTNVDLLEDLQKISRKMKASDCFVYLDLLFQAKRQHSMKTHVNLLLWLERLFCYWCP